MIKRLKDKIAALLEEAKMNGALMEGLGPDGEPELRAVGLFTEIVDEKIAEVIHALLSMNETNKGIKEPEKRKDIDFCYNVHIFLY